MKIYNIALATLTLIYSPAQIHAKETVVADTIQGPTFQSSVDQDETPANRYIVRYKQGSKEFESRMQEAARKKPTGNLRLTGAPDDQLLASGGFLPKDNAEVIYLNSEEEVKEWSEKDDVEYVERDTKVYLQAEQTPYGINKVHALDVPDTNVSNRKVCIIDTGYDINHPDLASDANVVTGYSGSFSAGAWDHDGHGHGTHVAGTIAAIGGNNQGVVGVNRNGQVKLHIVKVFNNSGNWAWGSSLIAAVEACVDSGSNIVSMSLGGGGFLQSEYDAYKRIFTEDDVLLVAAAGNGGNTAYSYPASYDYVMSVAATDSSDNVANFSQKNDQVDIAAPGVSVLSTLPSHVSSSGYASWSGTSMATPHVAGVAALVWSLDTSKSAAEIRGILEASAQDMGSPGRDNSYGHGLVRADRARDLMEGFTMAPTASPTPAPPCDDDPEGWYDSDGPTYDCAWYAQGSNCAAYGDLYENFGKTANEACCACGGGNRGTSPTASPTAFDDDDGGGDDCPAGQALLRVRVVTDANGAEENKYVVKIRNDSNKFRERVWLNKDLKDSADETFELCLPANACYKFIMVDAVGDGMCCDDGEGGYKVTWDGSLVEDTLSDLSFDSGKRSVAPIFGAC